MSNIQVQVLARVFDILDVLKWGPTTPMQLNQMLDIPYSTVVRLLSDLEKRGYVDRAENKQYSLGPTVVELAAHYLNQGLPQVAQPVLQWLANETNETVALSIRTGHEAVTIATIESNDAVKLSVALGWRRPLYAGASQKILLAYTSKELVEEVIDAWRQSSKGCTDGDIAKLREDLETVRSAGYAVSFGEVDGHAYSVAAPVWHRSGEVIAAVAAGGPISRVQGAEVARLRELVMEAAQRISVRLGAPGDGRVRHLGM